jgi:hypothetical protein
MCGVPALAAAVVMVAFVAGSSAAWAVRAAEGSAPSNKFVSKRYGYEMVLVGDWYAYYASSAWTGDFPFGDSRVDMFMRSDDRKFIVAAKRVPAGTTPRRWAASTITTMQTFCQKARAFRGTMLSGAAAREFTSVCPQYDVITVVALHRGRGYLVNFLSPNANAATADRRIYEAGRRSFRFTPE